MRTKHVARMISLLAIFFPGFLLAQATLTGTVKGKSTSLAGASITARPSGKGTTSDEDGKYTLKLAPGSYSITFSYAGFASQVISVQLTEGDQKTLDVDLTEDSKGLEDLIIVGSRSLSRTSVGTPLPVDVLSAADLRTTAQTTFDKQLQYRVPSFNTVNTPVNDATTLLDPYEIRNLGPSRTLVLINGKRKNLSSLLYVQFAPGRGETGADLSGIPVDAIKRVEILRDGASAQYGSDAIAGVMNVILKDRYQYSSLTFNSGITSKGDGANYGVAFNSGNNIGDKGFINYTVDFSQQNSAVRSGTIHRPTEKFIFGGSAASNAAIDAYLNRFPTGNNINGSGDIQAGKFNYNLGLPVGENGQFYSNAAMVFKKAKSFANFRTPYWRTDAGLLHKRIPGAPNYTGGNDPLYEGYLGYVPTFEGDLFDYNATVGLKNVKSGWTHDVAVTFGGNQILYTVENTVNRTLGTASPTSFKPGGSKFSHIVGNYDISKSITNNFSLAFGSEVRSETFEIIAGDTASYSGEGSNSFPGIRAENARTNKRFNVGVYVDATYDVTKDFLINAAIRGEKYSDFGDAFVWKASTRYKLADGKAVIRASASTGFRAPTLHQIYTQSTQASFAAGTIQLSGLFNNRSKQAFALGVPLLTPEKSVNLTFGVGLTPVKNLSITIDYYNITINDRIVYSSSINTNDKLLANPTTELGRILKGSSVGAGNFDLASVQFFINGVKTRTQGIDLVMNYKNIVIGEGKLGINLAGNYTFRNEILGSPNEPPAIKSANASILSAQIKSLITEGRPQYKAVLGFDYSINKFGFSLNNTLFGTTKFQDLDNGAAYSDLSISVSNDRNVMNDIKQVFSPAVVTDLNIGYSFTDKISVNIAVNNLLNVLPKWKLESLNADGQKVLDNAAAKDLLEGFLSFSGRYRILGYNGSQFSQLGTMFQAQFVFKF
ncbi:MAG: TonB-dependent receptor [Chitinophagaceae bacterium]|nr:TonB-dependent receptor [Chitinophagaceae bacterium]